MTLDEFLIGLTKLRFDTPEFSPKELGSSYILINYPIGDTNFYLKSDSIEIRKVEGGPPIIVITVGS